MMSDLKGVATPRSRANTNALKALYPQIENAKRRIMRGKEIDLETRERMNALGERIALSGIVTEELNIREKFAVVFIINHLFHAGNELARQRKDYVQRTIVLYHGDELKVKYIKSGKHEGTYKISFNIWSTHLPHALVEVGKLERQGKPSVKEVFQKRFRNLFGGS